MKFATTLSTSLLLSAAVLLPSIGVAAENSSSFMPIEAGKLYSITTSANKSWTIQVESIKGSWVKTTNGTYINIDNITSVSPI